MKVVWKYKLTSTFNEVETPKGSRFLSVEEQGNTIVAYALVDPGMVECETHLLHVWGTGKEVAPKEGEDARFIGTVKMQDGRYMFHVVEWTRRPVAMTAETRRQIGKFLADVLERGAKEEKDPFDIRIEDLGDGIKISFRLPADDELTRQIEFETHVAILMENGMNREQAEALARSATEENVLCEAMRGKA